MLPRLHPLTKTYTDLRRCEIRIEEFISRFPEDGTNDVEIFSEILETVQKAKAMIPKQFQ